ncbi:hypothetical protein EJ08DRAFT_203918 [Tothia fuscella]|uniref:Uncharacterized protein n=1 Tax=Tothia fuscella TaxID=1048955 RepID=A0A9P4TYR1_9PEZI|nr:hypothetical protein EJ08DRAFT_203918 [Tothia fuscella]
MQAAITWHQFWPDAIYKGETGYLKSLQHSLRATSFPGALAMSSTNPTTHDLKLSPPKTRAQTKQKDTNHSTIRQEKRLQIILLIMPFKHCRLDPSNQSLSRGDHTFLLHKQKWLRSYKVPIPPLPLCKAASKEKASKEARILITQALNATLLFAQEEAGTAVWISPKGYLLTRAHCVVEEGQEELVDDGGKESGRGGRFWLVFAGGRVVEAVVAMVDGRRDLALLRVVGAQVGGGGREDGVEGSSASSQSLSNDSFPYILPTSQQPPLNAPLACIAHPSPVDLETPLPKPGRQVIFIKKTNYDILHISTGALKHDCWTYWGCSGAPLVAYGGDGEGGEGRRVLIGLHSSWDEETGMRRGVGVEAVNGFLRKLPDGVEL